MNKKGKIATILLSFLLLGTVMLSYVSAQNNAFAITEKTQYGVVQNIVDVEITELLGKNQIINVSNVFANSSLTNKIEYTALLMNLSYPEPVYSLTPISIGKYSKSNETSFTDENSTTTITVHYYYSNDSEMFCDYVLGDKSCMVYRNVETGNVTKWDYLPIPAQKSKIVVNGISLEFKNDGIPIAKYSKVQLRFKYNHPIAIEANKPTTQENKYNIKILSEDGIDNAELDPTWWNNSATKIPITINTASLIWDTNTTAFLSWNLSDAAKYGTAGYNRTYIVFNDTTEIARDIVPGAAGANASIRFRIQANVNATADQNYSMYIMSIEGTTPLKKMKDVYWLGDDFNEATVNRTFWNVTNGAGTYAQGNSIMQVNTSGGFILGTHNIFSLNTTIELNVTAAGGYSWSMAVYNESGTAGSFANSNTYAQRYTFGEVGGGSIRLDINTGSNNNYTGTRWNLGTFYPISLKLEDTRMSFTNGTGVTTYLTQTFPFGYYGFGFNPQSNSGTTMSADYIKVYKSDRTYAVSGGAEQSPIIDTTYPSFSNYKDNNFTFTGQTATFNITLYNTNGSVFLGINGQNYSAVNLTSNIYNISITGLTNSTYVYYWGSWGNGTNMLYNISETRYYTVQAIPQVIFNTQSPADLNLLNFLGPSGVNITYNITSQYLDLTKIRLYYKSNSTTSNVMFYQNGTAFSGYFSNLYNDNVSSTFRWNLLDNSVLKGTYNLGEFTMENTVHSFGDLGAAGNMAKIQLLNVSNVTQFGFYEIMLNKSAAAGAGSPVYYCNSTYVSGAVTTSPNCVLFFTQPAVIGYNHTHTQYSSHQTIPFAVNTTTGSIGNIKVTSTSYFIVGGSSGGTWRYGYVNNASRAGAIQTSTNTGGAWTEQTYTIDSHLHQFESTAALWYYVCANDTYNNQNCTTPKEDLFGLYGLPPNVFITSPTEQTYTSSTININYSAFSPNGYAISNYSIMLYNPDHSYNSTIVQNTTSTSYAWVTNKSMNGQFVIKVNATDNVSQIGSAFSQNFTVNINYPEFTPTVQNNTEYTTSGLLFESVINNGNGTAGVEINGANFTLTNVSNLYSVTANVTAGVSPYYFWSYSNNVVEKYNRTAINYVTINKVSVSLLISLSPINNVTNGTETTASGIGCPAQLYCNFTRNDVEVSNPDIQTLLIGSYNYTYRTAGNANYTSAITSEIQYVSPPTLNDTTPPVIVLISPFDKSNVSSTSQSFIATINETIASVTNTSYIQNYTFWLWNSSFDLYYFHNETLINTRDLTVNTTLNNIPDGSYSWTYSASDSLNNYGYANNYTFTLDSKVPTISFSADSTAQNTLVTAYDYNNITENITYTDANLKNATYTLVGPYGYSDIFNFNISGLINSTYYNWSNLTDGTYTFTVTVYDTFNNKNQTSRVIYLTGKAPWNMSYVPPTELSGSILASYIPVNVTLNEPNIKNITIYLYNSTNGSVSYAASGSYVQTFSNNFVVPDGEYYFNATAWDIYEHSTSLPTYRIVKENEPGSITQCMGIALPGTYVLTRNVNTTNNTCYNVQVSGVTIDCRGYSITVFGSGIGIDTFGDMKINNCAIYTPATNGTAVSVTRSGTTAILNSTLDGTYGLYANSGSISIDNSTINDNTYGIFISGTGKVTSTSNRFVDNAYAIYQNYTMITPGGANGWTTWGPTGAGTYTNSTFSGTTTDIITLIGSDYNHFYTLSSSTGGEVRYSNSSNNYMTKGTLGSGGIVLTSNSTNNEFHDTTYSGSESVESGSNLTRTWTTTIITTDADGNHVGQSTVVIRDGTNRTVYTLPDGTVVTDIASYINNGTVTVYNPYDIYGFYTDYGNSFFTSTATETINSPTSVDLTFGQRIKSTILTRQVGLILMAMILLVGLAASTGFFVVKMRNGESVVDIWKYFIIMVIWNTLFLVIFLVLGKYVMNYFYPPL